MLNPTPSDDTGSTATEQALHATLRTLLAPLAQLVLAKGVPYAVLDELVRQALVQAADDMHPDLLPHRKVSRVSTATGINRREVTRLIQALREGRAGEAPPRRSLASEVFAHWAGDATYREADGSPRELPRQDPGDGSPSFESLAQAVTRDVHPRSLLDELVRLGLAQVDEERDRVALLRDAFVPRGDRIRMLQFLGANVGDHFAAAVENVLGDDHHHFEQAVFASGLSEESLQLIRRSVAERWKKLLAEVVPELEALVARDDGRPDATQRLRLGLYTYFADAARRDDATPANDGGPNGD